MTEDENEISGFTSEFEKRLYHEVMSTVRKFCDNHVEKHGDHSVQPAEVVAALTASTATAVASVKAEDRLRAAMDAMTTLAEDITATMQVAEEQDAEDDEGRVAMVHSFGTSVPMAKEALPECLHCALLQTVSQWGAQHGDPMPGDPHHRTVSVNHSALAAFGAAASLIGRIPDPDARRGLSHECKEHFDQFLAVAVEEAARDGQFAARDQSTGGRLN